MKELTTSSSVSSFTTTDCNVTDYWCSFVSLCVVRENTYRWYGSKIMITTWWISYWMK